MWRQRSQRQNLDIKATYCQREVKMSNFFYLLKYEKHEGVDLFENCLMVPGE